MYFLIVSSDASPTVAQKYPPDHNIGVIKVGAERIESTRGELKPLVMAAVLGHDQAPTENREASCSSGKR